MRSPVRFIRTIARVTVAVLLPALAVDCAVDLRGEASVYEGEAGSPSDPSSGSVASGSSDASLGDRGSDVAAVNQGPVVDGAVAKSTRGPSATVPEAAAGDDDAETTTTIPLEAGPSHGTMSCPADSDAGTCDLAANVCCTCPGCFAPYPTGCFPALTGCVGVVFSGVYARLACGDSTNCEAGSTCCAQFDMTGALTGSSCLSSCPTSGAAELCTNSAPCAAGKSCRPLTSAPGFNTCQ